jgi:DNA-damage-inducible protein J
MSIDAMVRVRVEPDVKTEAAAVLRAMGLTVSDATRMMLIRVARERRLPFEPWVPNETTLAAFRELEEGRAKRFNTLDDLMSDLHSDD